MEGTAESTFAYVNDAFIREDTSRSMVDSWSREGEGDVARG